MMRPKKQDHSISRSNRSNSTTNNNKKNNFKHQKHILLGIQHNSFDERQASPTPRKRQKLHHENHCKNCMALQSKLKDKEQYFKKIIIIYQQQSENLKNINNQLRQKLEDLFTKEKSTQSELLKLKKELIQKQPQSFLSSPIQKGKQLIVIPKLSENFLSELQSPTFSQLLAGTPHISKVNDTEILNLAQKEIALRAEFDRLMRECESCNSRSKKTTIRKQMASIANQLSCIIKQ